MKKHISFHLALRFMLLLAVAMLSLSGIIVFLLQRSVVDHQNHELNASLKAICSLLESSADPDGAKGAAGESSSADDLAFLELPYFITYVVYDAQNGEVISTNDNLLPLLESDEKSRTYFVKGFFSDGDLNIRYVTRRLTWQGRTVVAQAALDIVNDSAAWMLGRLPQVILAALLPVLLLSFALSFLISRQTIFAFRKLQADYDREKAFTSNVSHELKTPISIIDGHANLLKRWGKNDPAQLEQSIDAILHETETMNSIVTTLLDMSRLENGRIPVEKEHFFVTNLFERLREDFTAVYPDLEFVVEDKDYLELETDWHKLHQIFTVVIANSVKFAGAGSKIVLGAHKNGGKIVLSETDNGPGFTEEALEHGFERFYKGDVSHDRTTGGAGLGLAIAKSLADATGFSVRAENVPSGGARIVLEG